MAPTQEWLIIVPDHPNSLEKRMEVRPYVKLTPYFCAIQKLTSCPGSKHIDALKSVVSSGKIVFGGATLVSAVKEGESPKSNGSALIVVSDTKEEAIEVVTSDIYATSGVWDTGNMQIMPFRSAIRSEVALR
jgi:hypothetical protein